jgi:hypothetical protein
MDVSRWRRVFWTTFDWSHNRKCGKSLTMKASCIRSLIHQDRRWLENSIAKFWGDWVQDIQRKHPDKWRNNSWGLHHDDNAPAHMLFVVWQFLAYTRMTSPTLPTHWTALPVIFSSSQRWYWSLRGEVLTALKRSTPNRRTWWWHWHKTTSSSASNHENPAGISGSMQKGTTSKGMGANRSFGKWLSYGRGLLGTFG